MRKIRIKFQIKSLDTNNAFVTDGEIKNERLKFIDNEDNTNYIIFHKDVVEYFKKGNVDMKYKFKKDTTTKGEYAFGGYNFDFDIVTQAIIRSENSLRIKFDLYQNNDLVNKTEIILEYTFLEEE